MENVKYEFYLTATQGFIGQFVYPELLEVLVTRSNDTINLTSYSYYYDYQNLGNNAFLGNFSAQVNQNNNNEIIECITQQLVEKKGSMYTKNR